jgi:hypothetical protein
MEIKMKKKKETKKNVSLERIRNIAKDIIDDTEWINDSHTQAEHNGIKDGLERLIRELEE